MRFKARCLVGKQKLVEKQFERRIRGGEPGVAFVGGLIAVLSGAILAANIFQIRMGNNFPGFDASGEFKSAFYALLLVNFMIFAFCVFVHKLDQREYFVEAPRDE